MVAQEQRPLAALGDVRRLQEDLGDGVAVFLPQRHEHPRHQREVEGHVAFVAVAEVGAHVGRPLVRLGQQHPVLVARVELAPHLLQHQMRLGQVLVVGPLTHAQVRDRIQPHRVDAEVEPELHHVDDRVDDRGVVVIQIRLVREEPVPVVLPGDRVVGPVRLLGVGEDDPRLGKLLVVVVPDVERALGRFFRRAARALEPRVLIRGVVDDQLDEDLEVPIVRGADECLEVVERAVAGMDAAIVGDVVAVVFERRGEKGQQPDARDAERLHVIELLREALEVADAVVVAVEEGLDVDLIDDRVFVPERVVASTGRRLRSGAGRGCRRRRLRSGAGRGCRRRRRRRL